MPRAGVLERPDASSPAAGASAANAPRPSRRALLVAVFIVAAVGTALGLRGHAMWFDELQAWNIARSSHSLGELYASLRYEGHPIVWYLPLFVLTRFTGNPHAMQVLQWTIATTTFAFVLFRSPFSVPVRITIVAGYFFAFEYGVITRSYGVNALLVVLAAVLLARPRPAWWPAAAVLVLLAWTSLPGAVLAVAYAATVALTSRARWRWSLAVGIAAVAAALTCVPPSDFSSSFAPGLASDASTFGAGGAIRIANAAAGTWRGLVPIPASIGEWNSNLLDGLPGAAWIEAALSLLLFAVILRALRPFPFARRLWWIGSLGYVGFFMASDPAGSVSVRRVRVPALLVVRLVRDRTARRRSGQFHGARSRGDRPSAWCSRSCSRPRSSRPSRSTRPRLEPRSRATRHWRRPSTPPTSTTRSCPERTRTGRPSVPTSTARSTRSPATNGSATSSTTNARPTATAD